MPRSGKVPMRTCIACRQEKEKRELIRIVRNAQGEISLDGSGKLPGRGAYICRDEACFTRLRKQRLLHKAFSCDVPEEIYLQLEEEFLGKK